MQDHDQSISLLCVFAYPPTCLSTITQSTSRSRPQWHLGADARQRAQCLSGLAVRRVAQAMQPGCAAPRLRTQLRGRLYHKSCTVAKPSGAQVLLSCVCKLLQRRESVKQRSLRSLSAPYHQTEQAVYAVSKCSAGADTRSRAVAAHRIRRCSRQRGAVGRAKPLHHASNPCNVVVARAYEGEHALHRVLAQHTRPCAALDLIAPYSSASVH